MSTLAEIASAVDVLPAFQQELLLKHLASKLRPLPTSPAKAGAAAPEVVVWPDYESRLREIYGEKAMPSMVLAERETEPFSPK